MVDIDFKLVGTKELNQKLKQLEDKVRGKILRSAALQATTPTLQKMKMLVPVGKKEHKTYKGNIAFPGYTQRHIKRRTKYRDGSAYVVIGVGKEAFYGVTFLDRPGGYNLRAKAKNAARYSRKSGRIVGHVREHPWFRSVFEDQSKVMLDRFKFILAKKISQIARS